MVPATVKTITQNAFHSSAYLKEVVVPETVTAIQVNAFGYPHQQVQISKEGRPL